MVRNIVLLTFVFYEDFYGFFRQKMNQNQNNSVNEGNYLNYKYHILGVPMGRDSATFWDKGTEVPSLSGDKSCHGTRDGTITIFLSKSGTREGMGQHYFFSNGFLFQNIFSCFRMFFLVLEHPFSVLERLFPVFCLFGERDFFPGQKSLSRDFCSCPCPGTKGQRDKEIFLSRDFPWKPCHILNQRQSFD